MTSVKHNVFSAQVLHIASKYLNDGELITASRVCQTWNKCLNSSESNEHKVLSRLEKLAEIPQPKLDLQLDHARKIAKRARRIFFVNPSDVTLEKISALVGHLPGKSQAYLRVSYDHPQLLPKQALSPHIHIIAYLDSFYSTNDNKLQALADDCKYAHTLSLKGCMLATHLKNFQWPTQLKVLNVSCNTLSGLGEQLSHIQFPAVDELVLRWNFLGSFAKYLQLSPSTTHVDLSYNFIPDDDHKVLHAKYPTVKFTF